MKFFETKKNNDKELEKIPDTTKLEQYRGNGKLTIKSNIRNIVYLPLKPFAEEDEGRIGLDKGPHILIGSGIYFYKQKWNQYSINSDWRMEWCWILKDMDKIYTMATTNGFVMTEGSGKVDTGGITRYPTNFKINPFMDEFLIGDSAYKKLQTFLDENEIEKIRNIEEKFEKKIHT